MNLARCWRLVNDETWQYMRLHTAGGASHALAIVQAEPDERYVAVCYPWNQRRRRFGSIQKAKAWCELQVADL